MTLKEWQERKEVSFFIRCGKGHKGFTVVLLEGQDEEGGELTGDKFVYLRCPECGDEEVLEVAKE